MLVPSLFQHLTRANPICQTPILPTTPPKLKNNAEYQRLKQAMERVKHNIQGRGHDGDEVSDEVKDMMDEANDLLVDLIHKFESNRAEDS
jgi:hypothetical protein